jgi:nicotinate-nucleotide pyrophosphorylase (carboxylating)
LVVAREAGVLAGGPVAALVFEKLDRDAEYHALIPDGSTLARGTVAAKVVGPLRSLLTGERTALNFLQHLSGVATLTRRFVDAAAGTQAVILDTRKTIPGWRSLEKYAVRAGGGTNHRRGLYDGCLIKDNHIAAWREWTKGASLADAVREARSHVPHGIPIEIEVDTLEQLADALTGAPEIVLLDNMNVEQLRKAVELRNGRAPKVLLEASGGVTLATVAQIAATGVDRISSGALTHSAPALDLGFDWSRHLGK